MKGQTLLKTRGYYEIKTRLLKKFKRLKQNIYKNYLKLIYQDCLNQYSLLRMSYVVTLCIYTFGIHYFKHLQKHQQLYILI